MTGGIAALAYPIMWFLMPEEPAGAPAWPHPAPGAPAAPVQHPDAPPGSAPTDTEAAHPDTTPETGTTPEPAPRPAPQPPA